MIRFAVIGTNWITQRFIEAAHASGKMKLTAVYSRSLAQAQTFAADHTQVDCTDDLTTLANSAQIDAVYIASPNALHYEQSLLFMRHKKHVICEKPLASNQQQVVKLLACAREHQVVLFEAFKTAYLPNFLMLKQTLPRLGTLRRAFFNFCQYSSRYPRYLAGENPNTFNPEFSNGSIMDIGYYCLATAVALLGAPQSLQASAVLLESGVDAMGSICLHYGEMEVQLAHSKVSNSYAHSEIQGEDGTLVIEKLSQCLKIVLIPRGGEPQDLSQPQYDNTMQYEAERFAVLVEHRQVEHAGLKLSLLTATLLNEIRQQTGVVFPADRG